MKACEAGGSDAVPMACNARICSVAAPFHQCLTHGLPGLQRVRRTKTPFLQARPTRVAEIFGCRHASQCLTCLGKGWRQPACDAAACAGSSIAVCCFFRRSKPLDRLLLQHIRSPLAEAVAPGGVCVCARRVKCVLHRAKSRKVFRNIYLLYGGVGGWGLRDREEGCE